MAVITPLPDEPCRTCGRESLRLLPPFHHLAWARLRGLPLLQVPVFCSSCWTCYRHLHVQPRTVVGYHGCLRSFARGLASGKVPLSEWRRSEREYEWLGQGVYFWENAPARAWQWAREWHRSKADPAVVAVAVRLGRCFDLADTEYAELLRATHAGILKEYAAEDRALPANTGPEAKFRKLDCLVINECMAWADQVAGGGPAYQTVRCPFEEGRPVYAGAAFRERSHVQIAVRDVACLASRVFLVEDVT